MLHIQSKNGTEKCSEGHSEKYREILSAVLGSDSFKPPLSFFTQTSRTSQKFNQCILSAFIYECNVVCLLLSCPVLYYGCRRVHPIYFRIKLKKSLISQKNLPSSAGYLVVL